jgi:hypothetical protein
MIISTAWMSIALGLLAQIVVVILFVFAGEQLAGAKDLIRDTAKSMAWPLLVCVGITAGKALAMLRNIALQSKFMAIAGLLAAPIGLTAARLLHRSLGEAMSLGPKELALSLFAALVLVKVFQYGFIGAALGRIETNPNSHWTAHLGVGLVADAIFGVAALVTLGIAVALISATRNWPGSRHSRAEILFCRVTAKLRPPSQGPGTPLQAKLSV